MTRFRLRVRQRPKNSEHLLFFIEIKHGKEKTTLPTGFKGYSLGDVFDGKFVNRPDAEIMNARLYGLLSLYQDTILSIPDSDNMKCHNLARLIREFSKPGRKKLEKAWGEFVLSDICHKYCDQLSEDGITTFMSIMGEGAEVSSLNPWSFKLYREYLEKTDLDGHEIDRRMETLKILHKYVQETLIGSTTLEKAEAKVRSTFKEMYCSDIQTNKDDAAILDIESMRDIYNLRYLDVHVEKWRTLFVISFLLGGLKLKELVETDFSKGYIKRAAIDGCTGRRVMFKIEIPATAKKLISRESGNDGKLRIPPILLKDNCKSVFELHLPKIADAVGIIGLQYTSARLSFCHIASHNGISQAIIDIIQNKPGQQSDCDIAEVKKRAEEALLTIDRLLNEKTQKPEYSGNSNAGVVESVAKDHVQCSTYSYFTPTLFHAYIKNAPSYYSIRLELHHNGAVSSLATDIHLDNESQLEQGVIVNHPKAAGLNARLHGIIAHYQSIVDSFVDKEQIPVKELLRLTQKEDRKYKLTLEQASSAYTSTFDKDSEALKMFYVAYAGLTEFFGKTLRVCYINANLLDEYIDYLKGCEQPEDDIHIHAEALRLFLQYAKEQDYHPKATIKA